MSIGIRIRTGVKVNGESKRAEAPGSASRFSGVAPTMGQRVSPSHGTAAFTSFVGVLHNKNVHMHHCQPDQNIRARAVARLMPTFTSRRSGFARRMACKVEPGPRLVCLYST